MFFFINGFLIKIFALNFIPFCVPKNYTRASQVPRKFRFSHAVSTDIQSVKIPLLLDQLKSVLLGFLTLEDRTDTLFRNDGKELPLLAA